MAITKERLPRARVSLEIEVDQERVEKHMDRAVARLSKQVRVPGFRPGKVPRRNLERHVGTAALLQEALEELVPEVYQEALVSEELDAIDQPEFSLKSTEPLVVTAIVPVRPEIDLKDYQSLRAPKPEVTITDEQVADALTAIRRRHAVLEPVDRSVQWDDTVRADVTVTVDGQAEPHVEEDAEFPVREGSIVSLPGFVEKLIGLERGVAHHIEFPLPEDFGAEDLAGKTAKYDITIHEVKQEVLPEVDDEFVVSLDEEGVTTVAEMDARIRSDLQSQAERMIIGNYQDEIVDLLVATSSLDYPEVLVDREIDRIIDRESNHASHTQEGLSNWLNAQGTTLEDLRESLTERADLTVRRALVIGRLIEAEDVEITDEMIDAEIDSLAGQMGGGAAGANPDSIAAIRGLFDTPDGRASIKNQLITKTALERLVEICSQPEGEGAAAAPRASRRRRGGAAAEGDEAAAEATDDSVDESEATTTDSTEAAAESETKE